MIQKFEDFINEGRDADLYHWLDYNKVYNLVAKDVIYAKWKHIIDNKTVFGNSLTRNKNLSYVYQIRLTFDQSKLINNHKIIPIDGEKVFHINGEHDSYNKTDRTPHKFGISNYNESPYKNWNQNILAEEFVLGDIKNAHKYIKKIEIFNSLRGNTYARPEDRLIEEYADRNNIEFQNNKEIDRNKLL
jgi:hypothetical protein